MHRSGILQIITKRNAQKVTQIKEMEFRSVTLAQITPILALLATVALIAMLLLKIEIIVFTRTSTTK
jgi:hypothetical protein